MIRICLTLGAALSALAVASLGTGEMPLSAERVVSALLFPGADPDAALVVIDFRLPRLLASLAAAGCQGGYYAITTWVPRFLTTERHLSVVSSTGYLAALIIGFEFFYTALVFNSQETADNLKKSGALIPGIRPGKATADYVDGVLTRLTLAGSIYLVLVCLLPLTGETAGILDAGLFELMPPGSLLVNVGRGGHLVVLRPAPDRHRGDHRSRGHRCP